MVEFERGSRIFKSHELSVGIDKCHKVAPDFMASFSTLLNVFRPFSVQLVKRGSHFRQKKIVKSTVNALGKDGVKDIFKEVKAKHNWMKMKDAVSKKEKRVKTQLNFANLLKEEQLFLDKLIQMESFNFDEDFMFKDKRVRDSKVIQ